MPVVQASAAGGRPKAPHVPLELCPHGSMQDTGTDSLGWAPDWNETEKCQGLNTRRKAPTPPRERLASGRSRLTDGVSGPPVTGTATPYPSGVQMCIRGASPPAPGQNQASPSPVSSDFSSLCSQRHFHPLSPQLPPAFLSSVHSEL